MVHVLPLAKRVEVVAHLVEGSGIRPTSRLVDVSQPAILSLLLRMGEGCTRLHNRLVRNVECRTIEADEIWSYVQKKQARVTPNDSPDVGEAYAFVGMARSSKLVIGYRVGRRNDETTRAFVADMRARLVTMPQLYSDGFIPYIEAVWKSFGGSVDYAQVVKNYRRKAQRDDDHRYEPPRNPFITRTRVFGIPDVEHATTSHVERQNLTIRMHIRRFTRLCNGFSKRLPHHKAAVALHMMFYNFVRVHETIRVTPAMEAGLADRVWSVQELVEAALAEEESAPPVAQPLKLAVGAQGAARELPGDRGWLRVVDGGKGAPTTAPAPRSPPAAPAVPVAASPAAPSATVVPAQPVAPPEAPRQLDLLSWRPKQRDPAQLSLFDE